MSIQVLKQRTFEPQRRKGRKEKQFQSSGLISYENIYFASNLVGLLGETLRSLRLCGEVIIGDVYMSSLCRS
jgi:hypothetical protein